MSDQDEVTTAVYVAGSRSYHKAQDCVALGRHKLPQVVVTSLTKALRENRTACRLCCTGAA